MARPREAEEFGVKREQECLAGAIEQIALSQRVRGHRAEHLSCPHIGDNDGKRRNNEAVSS